MLINPRIIKFVGKLLPQASFMFTSDQISDISQRTKFVHTGRRPGCREIFIFIMFHRFKYSKHLGVNKIMRQNFGGGLASWTFVG